MKVSILSVFPDLYTSFIKTSLIQRAQDKGLVNFDIEGFFSYVKPKERIDAPSFGPGAGMLIKPEVVEKSIEDKVQKHGSAFKIFFSPQGRKLNQKVLKELAQKAIEKGHLMLIAARYEGMDSRVEEYYADEVLSVGDFVVMGGDLPAMLFLEGLLRLVPGVVGKSESVERESFSGPFVDYPEYTAPVIWKDRSVPDIVRSGNHAEIESWRMHQAAKKSILYHFPWVRSCTMNNDQKTLARQYIPPHYVVLLHSDVLIGEDRKVGTTSVTSIDIHDIARSSETYGVKTFFIVTPLLDQQKIVRKLLNFWTSEVGIDYNRHRHEAVRDVELQASLDDTIAQIERVEHKAPIVIGTSAREISYAKQLSYEDQAKIWPLTRPILLVFGTGKGLSEMVLKRCDYILTPVEGFTDFNHLSVRSAVGIVLDRWLGIQRKE